MREGGRHPRVCDGRFREMKPHQEGFHEVVLTYRENNLVACIKAYSDRVTNDSISTVALNHTA